MTIRQFTSGLEDVDLVVVTSGPRELLRLAAAGLPGGVRLLPAWTIGERAVLGPLMTEGVAGCWTCAALRLGANGDAGQAAELWSRLAPLPPLESGGREPGGPLAAMLGNLLGYEVFRLATGALAAETDGKLIVQDLDSMDVACEPLLAHPRCPRCAALTEAADAAEAAGLPAPTVAELTAADAPARSRPMARVRRRRPRRRWPNSTPAPCWCVRKPVCSPSSRTTAGTRAR